MSALRRYWPWAALTCGLAAYVVMATGMAQVYEDAYITFRVVDNFVNGYGLRWNVHERVQAYTNPLWMLLHIPFYAVWRDMFIVTLSLSAACTLGAMALVLRTFRHAPLVLLCLFAAPLVASRTLLTYATSGLENPLMHLLFAWAGWIVLRAGPKRFWLWLSLATSLAMVNRLDTVIILAPLWAYLLISRRDTLRYKQIIAGALPIIGWLSFSLFYYGFIFPNTKYAKLDTGIDPALYFEQGLRYFYNLVVVDAVSAAYIVFGSASALLIFWRHRKNPMPRSGILLAVALGILLYSLYVVAVGGTYVFGLFWSLGVFASLWLALALTEHLPLKPWMVALALVCVWQATHMTPLLALKKQCDSCFDGMVKVMSTGDPKLKHYMHRNNKIPAPSSLTKRMRNRMDEAEAKLGPVGIFGFRAGPEANIINVYGLTDALIARLPARAHKIYRIGHQARRIPAGYVLAATTGDLSGMDTDLREYYAPLRLIISGDLWDMRRLATIVAFNFGYFDHYRTRYLEGAPVADGDDAPDEEAQSESEDDTPRQPMSRRQNPSGQSNVSTAP